MIRILRVSVVFGKELIKNFKKKLKTLENKLSSSDIYIYIFYFCEQ